MKLGFPTVVVAALAVAMSSPATGFTVGVSRGTSCRMGSLQMSTMADSGAPPTTSDPSDVPDDNIPTNLPSERGMDYIPLATMLATGQLAEADQVGIPWNTFSFFFSHQELIRNFH